MILSTAYQSSQNSGLWNQYIYTFTDYIDNVSSVSLGARKGDKGTDKLMTASIGVTYNFHF